MEGFIKYIEIIGIIAFAISGALEGIKSKLDLLGVIVLGIVTATGGGVIRDLILGIRPPFNLRSGFNIYLAIGISLLVFLINLFDDNVNRWTINRLFDKSLIYSDAIGLAVFTITGMEVAYRLHTEYSIVLYVFVGVVTGVGGGIIRDTLINAVPYILDRHVYASASLIGAIIFHLLTIHTDINRAITSTICILIIFTIRVFAHKYKWNLPKATKIIN